MNSITNGIGIIAAHQSPRTCAFQDDDSIKMVSEKFAEISHADPSLSRSSATIVPAARYGRNFSGSVLKGTPSKDLPLVNPDVLRSLSPGHFFGHLSGATERSKTADRFQPEVHGRLNVRTEFWLSDGE